MAGAIFLSAGVPDPKRGSEFAKTADTVAINSAVSALLFVTLGRRVLVWGGHPAITPMVWVVAQDIGIDYGRWVKLYQSKFFEDEFPEDNERFHNVTLTDVIENDREQSLLAMRRRMFTDNHFDAAVFIGGMAGVLAEFELFRQLQPTANVVPIFSTGGATLELRKMMKSYREDLTEDLDYVALLHRHLNVPMEELREKAPGI